LLGELLLDPIHEFATLLAQEDSYEEFRAYIGALRDRACH